MDNLITKADLILKNGEDLSKLVNDLELYNSDDWKEFIYYSKDYYKKNLARKTDTISIYIICWNKDQYSKIHNHPDKGCAVKMLKGSIKEECYKFENDNLTYIKSKELKEGLVNYNSGSVYVHKMIPLEDSISLHIYPNDYKMKVY